MISIMDSRCLCHTMHKCPVHGGKTGIGSIPSDVLGGLKPATESPFNTSGPVGKSYDVTKMVDTFIKVHACDMAPDAIRDFCDQVRRYADGKADGMVKC